jgi:hypothetical protein
MKVKLNELKEIKMIVYDINMKEIELGDTVKCGAKKYKLELQSRSKCIKMNKKVYKVKELSHYEINSSVIVLYDFVKVENKANGSRSNTNKKSKQTKRKLSGSKQNSIVS